MSKDVLRDTYNRGIASCIDMAHYRAELINDAVQSLGLKGTTSESKAYLLHTKAEIDILNDLCNSLERLKI